MDGEKNKVADRLRGLCSRREYCRSEIMKKALAALDGDAASAAEVVDILVDEKYIDELRYASAFARDKSAIAGWGEVKIRYMLLSKGLTKETIDEALGEIDEGKASDKLYRLLANKAKSLDGDSQIKMKLLRFALGRGYGYDDVKEIINELIQNGQLQKTDTGRD